MPLPLDESALNELRAELAAANGIGAALDETEQAAPEALEARDLALDISSDVDAALIDAFLHDSPPQAAEVTQSLQGWIADPAQTELLRNAKRAAHTLKGSANILGIRGVAKLAHRLEDILEICETDSAPPSSMRAQALMSAADCLEQMVAAVAGEDARARTTRSRVIEMLDAARNNDASDTVRQRALEAPARGRRPAIPLAAAPAPRPRRSQGDHARAHAVARQPGAHGGRAHDQDRRARPGIEIRVRPFARLDRADRAIQKRLSSSRIPSTSAASPRATSCMPSHARIRDFDSLEMDQYNEVQSLTRALIEETTDARDLGVGLKDELAGLAGILHQQQRLMRELQHLTSQTRMAPVETIVPRLQRNVRQTAAATHKQASLVVVGQDILVDADVLNQLIDPLLHILRNAVDHGLESPEEREAVGKPRAGTITLTVARRGQVVTVQVADDGRGLNLATSAAKAIERGLLDRRRHAQRRGNRAPHAAARLLHARRGHRDLRPRRRPRRGGHAPARTLRLHRHPLGSRPRSHHRTALPGFAGRHARAVRARWRPGVRHRQPRRAHAPFPPWRCKLVRENGALLALRRRHAKYPGARARVAHRHARRVRPERRNLVLVDTETGPIGVLVDAVLEASELVTRPTGRYLKRIPGVAGIGLTGNGSVIPLLDIAELARTPRDQAMRAAAEARSQAQELRRSRVLVVDDSMSVRRAVATLLEDHGYDVTLARDGLEAVKSMEVGASRRAAHRSRNAQHERPRARRARALAPGARQPASHHDHLAFDGQTSPPGDGQRA